MNNAGAKKLMVLALLTTMPVLGVVAGCGGNSSGVRVPRGTFVGDYTGSYRVTSGPNVGETGPISVRVSSNGMTSSRVTDAAGVTIVFSGNTNLSTGAFSLQGEFIGTQTSGRVVGILGISGSRASGNGTFEIINGNRGTFTLSQT